MTRRVLPIRQRHTGRVLPVACLTGLLTLVGLSACSPEDADDASPAASTAPSDTRSSPTELASPATAPEANPIGTATDPAAEDVPCADDQRRALRRLLLFEITGPVTSSTTGFSSEAARQARKDAARAAEQLKAACGTVPPAARRYFRDVRRNTQVAFGDRQLDLVLAARLKWAQTVGADKPVAHEMESLRACRDLKRRMTVSYRVWWRWTDTGRMWWVELAWHNRTGKTVTGSLWGMTTVHGLLPDAFGWITSAESSGPGEAGYAGWGGSSADMAWVKPGRSRQVFAPGADQDVHTTADGTIEVTMAEAVLYAPGPGVKECSVPLPEMS